jgi:hypothetical protein
MHGSTIARLGRGERSERVVEVASPAVADDRLILEAACKDFITTKI